MLRRQKIPSFYGIFAIVALVPQIFGFNDSAFNDVYKIFTIIMLAAMLFCTAKVKLLKPFVAFYLMLTLTSKLCTCISSGYSLFKGLFDYLLIVLLFVMLYVFPQEIKVDSRKSIFNFYYIYAMFMLFACAYNMIKHFNSLIHITSINIYNPVDLCSFFDNKNTFGVYLLFGVVSALALRLFTKKKRWTLLIMIFMINEYMAMCRTAMLISLAIVVITLMFTDYKKYRVLIFLGVMIIAVMVVLASFIINKVNPDKNIIEILINNAFSNTDSLEVRDEYVKNMLPLIRGRAALFGYGEDKAANFALLYTENRYYHNSYLKVLMTGGIFRMLLQAILIFVSLKNSLSVYKKNKSDGLICFISVITYLVYATAEAVILLDAYVLSMIIAIIVVTMPQLFNSYYKNDDIR